MPDATGIVRSKRFPQVNEVEATKLDADLYAHGEGISNFTSSWLLELTTS